MISKIAEPEPSAPAPAAQVIGNQVTVQLCARDAKDSPPGLDPWLKSDPWAPGGPAMSSSGHDPQATIRDFESRVEKSLLDKLNANKMEVDTTATEARVAALEQQVQSLAAHQQQMEITIDESAKRADSQIASLQTQVTSQIDMQGQHIQGMFQAQLQQIEALLTKRARTE